MAVYGIGENKCAKSVATSEETQFLFTCLAGGFPDGSTRGNTITITINPDSQDKRVIESYNYDGFIYLADSGLYHEMIKFDVVDEAGAFTTAWKFNKIKVINNSEATVVSGIFFTNHNATTLDWCVLSNIGDARVTNSGDVMEEGDTGEWNLYVEPGETVYAIVGMRATT